MHIIATTTTTKNVNVSVAYSFYSIASRKSFALFEWPLAKGIIIIHLQCTTSVSRDVSSLFTYILMFLYRTNLSLIVSLGELRRHNYDCETREIYILNWFSVAFWKLIFNISKTAYFGIKAFIKQWPVF